MEVVIARVNRNSAGMNFLLRGGGVRAVGQYVDETGRLKSFDMTGILLYRKPRSLYLRLEHTLAGKMEIGSNDEEFWVWERFDNPRYLWGRHELTDCASDVDLLVRPDHLLEMLGLGDLPTETKGPTGPVPWTGWDYYELVFLTRNAAGQLRIAKTIDIERREPFLVRSIVYFRADGHPFMVAKLSEYKQIQGSTVLAPHKIRIEWRERQDRLELTFREMKRFDQPQAEKTYICRSPLQRGLVDPGCVERVDHPSWPGTRPTSSPAAQPDAVIKE